jgi:hypothetical protein
MANVILIDTVVANIAAYLSTNADVTFSGHFIGLRDAGPGQKPFPFNEILFTKNGVTIALDAALACMSPESALIDLRRQFGGDVYNIPPYRIPEPPPAAVPVQDPLLTVGDLDPRLGPKTYRVSGIVPKVGTRITWQDKTLELKLVPYIFTQVEAWVEV